MPILIVLVDVFLLHFLYFHPFLLEQLKYGVTLTYLHQSIKEKGRVICKVCSVELDTTLDNLFNDLCFQHIKHLV
jgi:hypothetical protein